MLSHLLGMASLIIDNFPLHMHAGLLGRNSIKKSAFQWYTVHVIAVKSALNTRGETTVQAVACTLQHCPSYALDMRGDNAECGMRASAASWIPAWSACPLLWSVLIALCALRPSCFAALDEMKQRSFLIALLYDYGLEEGYKIYIGKCAAMCLICSKQCAV